MISSTWPKLGSTHLQCRSSSFTAEEAYMFHPGFGFQVTLSVAVPRSWMWLCSLQNSTPWALKKHHCFGTLYSLVSKFIYYIVVFDEHSLCASFLEAGALSLWLPYFSRDLLSDELPCKCWSAQKHQNYQAGSKPEPVCSRTLTLVSFFHTNHWLALLHVLDVPQDHSQHGGHSHDSLQGNAW